MSITNNEFSLRREKKKTPLQRIREKLPTLPGKGKKKKRK